METAVRAPDIEVFFDGACPLCKREVQMLRGLDRARQILFTDIAAASFKSEDVGVEWESLMGRIHGRLPDGTLIQGVDVFRHLYAVLGFRKLVQLSRLPGISQFADLAYHLFAANRMRLTGRCANNTCTLPTTTPTPNHPEYAAQAKEGRILNPEQRT
jgi:predicted DCC family thiol-disulfide oxidoreductase YuxK